MVMSCLKHNTAKMGLNLDFPSALYIAVFLLGLYPCTLLLNNSHLRSLLSLYYKVLIEEYSGEHGRRRN